MARPVILSGVSCYFCGSDQTCKAGISKSKQRFKCRGCGRFFIDPEARQVKSKAKSETARRYDPVHDPMARGGVVHKGTERPSPGHLILKLRAIAQSLGRTPTTTEINELSKVGRSYPLHKYYDAFGSYLAALKKARLKLRYKQEFDEHDRERMLGELRRLRKKLKRPIFDEDVDAARRRKEVSPPYHFIRAFGSVPKAIEAAGAGKKIYSRIEMLVALRELDKELDRPVQMSDVRKAFAVGRGPSYKAIVKEFGGIVEARAWL